MYVLLRSSRIGTNHCQNGTEAFLYNLEICSGENCHNFGQGTKNIPPSSLVEEF